MSGCNLTFASKEGGEEERRRMRVIFGKVARGEWGEVYFEDGGVNRSNVEEKGWDIMEGRGEVGEIRQSK